MTRQNGPRTIWKYEIGPQDVQRIGMPKGARLIHVAGQHVEEHGPGFARAGMLPMLWALVDPAAPMVERLIALVGTGHPCPDEGDYVGSAVCDPFVWHIFDGGEADG